MSLAGKLRPCYEAVCACCEKDAIGLAFTRPRAEKCLRNDLGWHHVAGRGWVCGECFERGRHRRR